MYQKVTVEQYTAAVGRLIEVALQGTSGGRIAAQVLLSAYNGFEFQLDVAGLGNLDSENYCDAVTVIRGRYETGREPHVLIDNGSKLFRMLWDQWCNLHVKERGKETCPACDGRGEVYADPYDEKMEKGTVCTRCSGKGRVCRCLGNW